jgi:aryl-alcohol dehydrogenase-like predicted oxidoreductase
MGTWRTFDVRDREAERRCMEIVRTACADGAVFFDSSPMYGEAERVLGTCLAQLKLREKSLVATKVWTSSRSESRQQMENALAFFGGRVDLYQVHNLVGWQERLAELEALKRAGRVGAVGITHYRHDAFEAMGRIMASGKVEAIQIPYNALDRAVESALLPLAERLNIGVVVMKPLGQGALVRRSPPDRELAPLKPFGVKTWPQALLKWVASDPRVSVVIPATSRAERMAENAAAGNPPWFDPDTRERVSRLAGRYI